MNDSLGHHVGDQLLMQVAERLGGQLRAGDLLARLGGDEFAVLLERGRPGRARLRSPPRLHDALCAPFTLEDISLHTVVSIGIALFPDHGNDVSTLLRRADLAMYKAKTARVRPLRLQHQRRQPRPRAAAHPAGAARPPWTDDQLVLHFQPKIDLRTGEVRQRRGAGALGSSRPADCSIPEASWSLVEDSGLDAPADRSGARAGARPGAAVAGAGHADECRGQPVRPARCVDAELPASSPRMLALRRLPPQTLQLEITEESLMADRDRARDVLTSCGTAASRSPSTTSAPATARWPTCATCPSTSSSSTARSSSRWPTTRAPRPWSTPPSTWPTAWACAWSPKASRDRAAYSELSRYGCDQIQGFYISRPVPAAEFDHWMSRRSARVSGLAHGARAEETLVP